MMPTRRSFSKPTGAPDPLRGRKKCLALLPVVWLGILSVATVVFAEGEELIGTPAPEFEIEQWVRSEPVTLARLKGSVVLVRFWTDGCPLCSDSAPVLSELQERYGRDGLVVVGIYHPKPAGDVDRASVEQAAEMFKTPFAIGLDPDWKTLDRYWLRGFDRAFTSSSFLIDRQGIIRFVHPGGSYAPEDVEAMEDVITRLLARTG